MKSLYIITGPAGVGKSTISNVLANKLQKSALIEGDEIYHQVISSYVSAWKDGNHLELFYKNCTDLIRNYLEYGYDVIFNYIFNPDEINKIVKKFNNVKIKFIVLITDEETLMQRDKERTEDCRMNERCIILLNSFKNQNFNKKYILDTSNLTTQESVNKIINEERFYIK